MGEGTGMVGAAGAADKALPTASESEPALGYRSRRALAVSVLCGLCLSALFVFRPWQPQPFDVLDFSEFLLLLQRLDGPLEQWAGLSTYYASQGRVNQVGYAVITANYQLFGLDPLGWRVVGAVQMLVLPVAAFAVLRRFGAGLLAAVIGSSLFAFGSVPTSAWLRQTGEPVGALFMLGAALMAHGWAERPPDLRRTVLLTGCLIGMVFSKETLVACLPFLTGVAVCWTGANEVRRPRAGRAAAHFVAACLVACLLLGGALLWSASQSHAAPYVAQYGTSSLSGIVIGARAAQMVLPVFAYGDLWKVAAFPPNLVVLAGIVLGVARLARVEGGSIVRSKIGLALLLPVAGILVYLPWPKFEPFYALPFTFGTALAIGLMVDASGIGPRGQSVLVACWLFVLAASALWAVGPAQYTAAHRHLNHAVAQRIARRGAADTVHLVTAGLTHQDWQNPAATMGRYVRALGLSDSPPVLVDIDCLRDNAWLHDFSLSRAAIVFETGCGRVQRAAEIVEYPYAVFNWMVLGFERRVDRAAVMR